MTSYKELLRDYHWQRFSHEVMRRDNYTCQECWREDVTLAVHHNYYEYGKMPWEYPIYDEWPHAVEAICWSCHTRRDEIRKAAKDLVRIADRRKRGVDI